MKCLPAFVVALLTALVLHPPVSAQVSSRPCPPPIKDIDPLGTCRTALETLGELPAVPLYWHLDVYPTLQLAESAKGPRSTVVESLGRVWLFTIADRDWRPKSQSGERMAEIGPLPVLPGVAYTAVYMQSIFAPGTESATHTHSGPEAFFTLTGRTCLETPDGVIRGEGPNNSLIVPAGPPMQLTATGTEQRRGVVLILHDSSRGATSLDVQWKPAGLCKT